jgi:hypothetical protein
VPIRGRTPQECFEQFYEHVGRLVSDVLDPLLYVTMVRGDDANQRDMQLGSEGANTVRLKRQPSGHVHFYLAQNLVTFRRPDAEVASESQRYQLKTQQYWYKVFDGQPDLKDEPLFRWEYVADVPDGERWCRHHFQIGKVDRNNAGQRKAVEVPFAGGTLDLNRLHIATGFTLMEFVFRFLFTELGVVPATADWEAKLSESESKFFRDFSGKTSAPADDH